MFDTPPATTMSDHLLRQRRNLMITCSLLWFMKYGGLKLDKLSLSGVDVSLSHAEALPLAIWMAFFYFLIRYYQYFATEGTRALNAVFELRCEAICNPIISKVIKGAHPSCMNTNQFSYKILKSWDWVYHGSIESPGGGRNSFTYKIESVRKRRIQLGLISALTSTAFRSNVVTDFLFPFALSAFIIGYCGADNWDGSIFRIIYPLIF